MINPNSGYNFSGNTSALFDLDSLTSESDEEK
jgi:hypothetical protein